MGDSTGKRKTVTLMGQGATLVKSPPRLGSGARRHLFNYYTTVNAVSLHHRLARTVDTPLNMSALNLPKPKNTYAGEDELRSTPAAPTNGTNGDSNGATAEAEGDEGEYVAPKPSDRFKEGLIYPPREVRSEC